MAAVAGMATIPSGICGQLLSCYPGVPDSASCWVHVIRLLLHALKIPRFALPAGGWSSSLMLLGVDKHWLPATLAL